MLSVDKPFTMIAAVNNKGVIGNDNSIPWRCVEDLTFFRSITTTAPLGKQNAVIMGSRTWDSLKGPLNNRLNIVISSTMQSSPNVKVFRTLTDAYMWLRDQVYIDKQFIIGGAQLFETALTDNWSKELILTTVDNNSDGDTKFPDIPSYYLKTKHWDSDSKTCSFDIYQNKYSRHLEQQYLQHMHKLILNEPRPSRNAMVHDAFQWTFETHLSDGLPLFSTRKAFWKGICEELLFFIKGYTDTGILSKNGIHIWRGNTTREFLDSRGLDYQEGDMGPMYGYQWRHYGAEYKGMHENYQNKGFDQLEMVTDLLENDPYSRRILMTVYDPSKVEKSVLAPCHSIVNQFYVRDYNGVRYLDMFTYQRSADMFLGVYFNIPSNALLLTIIAHSVHMTPGKLSIRFGDTHVYSSHVAAVREQLDRIPNATFPTLTLQSERGAQKSAIEWIESLTFDDFKISDYHPQAAIKTEMIA